jgi:hypothetical protein
MICCIFSQYDIGGDIFTMYPDFAGVTEQPPFYGVRQVETEDETVNHLDDTALLQVQAHQNLMTYARFKYAHRHEQKYNDQRYSIYYKFIIKKNTAYQN